MVVGLAMVMIAMFGIMAGGVTIYSASTGENINSSLADNMVSDISQMASTFGMDAFPLALLIVVVAILVLMLGLTKSLSAL